MKQVACVMSKCGRCQALIWLLGVLLFAGGISADAQEQPPREQEDRPGIEWSEDLESARRKSREEGRPVIAYFTFDTCVWCKRLEQACFFEPEVVELSRQFIWVKVNRDETPDIPKELNVSAYPSLLTLGDELENIYRFQSYQEPPEFMDNLQTALRRYQLYRAGEEWMEPPQRPARVIDAGTVTTIRAPSDAVPGGITVMGDSVWLAQGRLFQLNAKTGQVLNDFELPRSVGDLCHDGKHLYAMTFGWTAGKPIYVIDPSTGEVVREIVTEANRENRAHGAKGIAWRDGRLYVLSGMRGQLFEVDPGTGEITDEIELDGQWMSGLAFDGDRVVTGGREQLTVFDLPTGQRIRAVPCHYPIRNVAVSGRRWWLMEQPIFGFGRQHERIQVWPQQTVIYRWTDAE